MTTSASAASALAAVVPVEPMAPTRLRVVVAAVIPLPAWRLADRDAGLLAERGQRLARRRSR